MIVALILAGLVSFAAGSVLHVGAFVIFAAVVSLIAFAVGYTQAWAALALFFGMQLCYLFGVLMPLPAGRQVLSRRLSFSELQRQIESLLKNVG